MQKIQGMGKFLLYGRPRFTKEKPDRYFEIFLPWRKPPSYPHGNIVNGMTARLLGFMLAQTDALSFCLTFEFTRSRKRAKPAVASRVQRRVRPHGCSEALGCVACPKFMAMKKVHAERTSSFASGCDLAGQLSGSYPNSRSSCEQRQALAIFAAHWTAASRVGSSRTPTPQTNSLSLHYAPR